MKSNTDSSITGPLLKEIIDLDQAQQAALPKIENGPELPADFLHDDGSGYNSGFVFPQD